MGISTFTSLSLLLYRQKNCSSSPNETWSVFRNEKERLSCQTVQVSITGLRAESGSGLNEGADLLLTTCFS